MFEKIWRFLKPVLHVLQDIWIQTRFLKHVLHRLQKVSEKYKHFLNLCCVRCKRFQFKQEDFWNSWLKLLKIWINLKIFETCVASECCKNFQFKHNFWNLFGRSCRCFEKTWRFLSSSLQRTALIRQYFLEPFIVQK